MVQIDSSFILLDLEATDSEMVIHKLSERMYEAGAVDAGYAAATITREQAHPTGLPTRPFCIAFPHADAQGVLQSSLAVASLKHAVSFQNMADPDEALDVEIVFLLANRDPEEQVQTLRRLALIFGEPEKLTALRSIEDAQEAADWLRMEILAVD